MIRELKETDIPNWDEIITLQLTLKDLQILFDAIGGIPPRVLKEKHEQSSLHDVIFESEISASKLIDKIYSELEDIIDKHNGVLDLV